MHMLLFSLLMTFFYHCAFCICICVNFVCLFVCYYYFTFGTNKDNNNNARLMAGWMNFGVICLMTLFLQNHCHLFIMFGLFDVFLCSDTL